MKTIIEGKQSISGLWGKQLPENKAYRIMKYTLSTECEDGILMYNVVTGELALISSEEKKALEDLPSLPVNELKMLISHHFIVPEEFDEKESVHQLRNILKRLQYTDAITSYTILPTTGCNAKCYYCYESDFPHVTMSCEVADQIVEYIANHCGKEKKVNLHWFGGEPMVAKERINQICEGLLSKGIDYKSRMTSNASLFSEDVARHARKKWHLYEIQITLDGTEKVYNKTKAYVGLTKSPFKTVIDNIGYLLAQKVYVIIRLNIGLQNIEDLQTLVRELANQFRGNTYLSVYPGILFENAGFEGMRYSDRMWEILCWAKIHLEKIISEEGLYSKKKRTLPQLEISHCMADNDKTVLISPLGELGKCEHAVFDQLVGSVFSKKLDNEEVKNWKTIHSWIECENCCLYPKCVMLERCENLTPCKSISFEDEIAKIKTEMIKQYRCIKD